MSHKRRRQESADAHWFVYAPGSAVPRDATHVVVHHSVEVLPARVFAECRQLKEVVLPEGLREIGHEAFDHCETLEHITLPSTLKKICSYAFYYCKALGELSFPEGLTEIDECAFCGCSSLDRIRVPSSVTTISDGVFGGCSSLKVVRLVNGIQTIGGYAFMDCALEDITLPATVTSVGECVFTRCGSLRTIEIRGCVLTIPVTAFRDCFLLDHVRVPAKALVVTGIQGRRQFNAVMDGTFSPSNSRQVVIVSECLNSMREGDTSEAKLRITEILDLQEEWDAQRARLLAVFAPYKLRHKKKVTTLLELGLWKARMEAAESGHPESRAGCRANCGAAVVVPNVLCFLLGSCKTV